MADNEHGRIIASEAKIALQPVGFRRKGQSRTWIADRGFWLSVVEFQPSSWSRGSYLNVAVHWLWGLPPHLLGFDRFERVGSFIEFENPEQFLPLASRMAAKAAEIAELHRSTFASVTAAAKIMVREVQSAEHGVWAPFHAGVAAGLSGDLNTARLMLESARGSAVSQAQTLLAHVDDPDLLRNRVSGLIEAERSYFKLGSLTTTIAS